ncbi:MAG: hypothetical protein IT370_02515 [Deltaproteobacteria bacterium]|nr:hypothetical protein [Deltaproteobacteria bacterium]
MSTSSDKLQALFTTMARAMFLNRLHLLRLTEVVRHGIRPNDEGVLLLPDKLDKEMKDQAWEFVMAMVPEEYHLAIVRNRAQWMDVQ